ncbi:MAG: ABC transporter ATP-binding protein [Synergistaceae bacterium]
MRNDDNILEIKNLTVSFKLKNGREHIAVDNFSIELKRGETLAIVGESGSGKTTMMRAVMGLVGRKEGEVLLLGKDISKVSSSELRLLRQQCGYIPQDPYGAIPPGLSVLSAVMEPYFIVKTELSKKDIVDKATGILNNLGLNGERILSSRAVSLSGGQRQRVEIARALMFSPQLLLCDEPTSMQDVSTRGEIIDILKAHVKRGASLLFITHDLLLAGHVAEWIVVMKEGKICEYGRSSEVLSFPKHEYTKKLLEAVPVIKSK